MLQMFDITLALSIVTCPYFRSFFLEHMWSPSKCSNSLKRLWSTFQWEHIEENWTTSLTLPWFLQPCWRNPWKGQRCNPIHVIGITSLAPPPLSLAWISITGRILKIHVKDSALMWEWHLLEDSASTWEWRLLEDSASTWEWHLQADVTIAMAKFP